MYVLVLTLGIFALAGGVLAIGFGITIKEFSLGNALLIAGAISIVGGLVLIGIAAAIRELSKISRSLVARPMPRYPRPGEPLDPNLPGAIRPGMSRPPMRPMPPFPPLRHPAGPGQESHLADSRPPMPPMPPMPPVPSMSPAPTEPPPEFPERFARSASSTAQTSAEPVMVEEPEAFPLSPHQPFRAPSEHVPDVAPSAESSRMRAGIADDAHVWRDDRDTDAGRAARSDVETPPEAHERSADGDRIVDRASSESVEHAREGMGKAEPSTETANHPATAHRHSFDDIWPERDREERLASTTPGDVDMAEAVARDERSVVTDADDALRNREAVQPLPGARDEQRPVATAADVRERAEVEEVEAQPEAEEAPRAVSILKSGVVDGMAYTLYSDGSIEADLAGEIIHFASIEELRQHIEAGA